MTTIPDPTAALAYKVRPVLTAERLAAALHKLHPLPDANAGWTYHADPNGQMVDCDEFAAAIIAALEAEL